MADPRALYSQAVLDHGKHPRNARIPASATRRAEGYNAVCGDRLVVGVTLAGERLDDLGFDAAGCAICVASASAMTVAVKGTGRAEAIDRARRFLAMVRGDDDAASTDADLVELAFFREVGRYPVRIGCATLAWTALTDALAGEAEALVDDRPRPRVTSAG
jgi:nitrogen fixation NifU-like protein